MEFLKGSDLFSWIPKKYHGETIEFKDYKIGIHSFRRHSIGYVSTFENCLMHIDVNRQSIYNASFHSCIFENSQIYGCFRYCRFIGCIFRNCYINISFKNSILQDCDFDGRNREFFLHIHQSSIYNILMPHNNPCYVHMTPDMEKSGSEKELMWSRNAFYDRKLSKQNMEFPFIQE